MDSKELIPVCRDLFLSTLLLSKNRAKGVVHRHYIFGTSPTEKRGGDRKSNQFMDFLAIGILVLIQQKDFYLKKMYKKLMF